MPTPSKKRFDPSGPQTVNQRLLTQSVNRWVYMERFKGGVALKVRRFLDRELFPDLTGRLAERLERIGDRGGEDFGPLMTDRLSGVTTMIGDVVKPKVTGELRELIEEELGGLAVSEARWQVATMRKVTEAFGLDYAMPSPSILRSIVTSRAPIGKTIEEHLEGISNFARDEVASQLRIGIAQGESVGRMITRVRGTLEANYADGIYEKVRGGVEAVVRTSTNFVVNQAREQTMAENADIVDRVQLVATLDTRTSPICRARDGEVYPVNEGPRPPFHPNCRTMAVPVTKSWDDLGLGDRFKKGDPQFDLRESIDGEVAGDITYEDWLGQQPKARQLEILGPARYDLWKREGLSLKDMIDTRGRTLTLDELDELTG